MKTFVFLQGVYYGKYEKFMHFFVSVVLFFGFVSVFKWPYAVLTSFGIGVLKEFFDKYIKKTIFDWKDIMANLMGIFFAVTFYFLYLYASS